MRRRGLGRTGTALLALALTLPVLTTSAARAATPKKFTFYGSGYGHGLGLPQWGAYTLAQRGWGYGKILRHFYTGTSVGPAPSSPSRLRIGLVHNRKVIRVSSVAGTVALRLGSTGGKLIGRAIKQGETWQVIVAGSGRYRILNAAGKVVGGHLWGGVKTHVYAVYAGSGKLRVPEAGHTYNRGFVEFNVYGSSNCPKLAYCERAIIVLNPQAYLYGLAEVPSGWPMTALKVQAVAARTYAFEKVSRVGQHRLPCNCALYDDTNDQVYAGWDKEGGPMGARWVSAVTDTKGTVVLYGGGPIQAYYHSASGGFTESNEFVWGGSPIPYLRGVCDPGDYSSANPNTVWKVGPLPDSTVTSKLRPYTGNIGTVTGFTGAVRGVSGRIVTVTVVGTSGQKGISGTSLRRGLGLKDARVWINANRQVTGDIRARYDALMCAPGLPASRQQAVPGGLRQRFADGAIYWNQARAAAYWIHGPIYDKYRDPAIGENAGFLGLPRSDVISLPDPPGCTKNTCAMAKFEQGRLYFKDGIGDGTAHELHGYVLDHYVAAGEFGGHLGFPVTDVNVEPDDSTWATFEHGVTVTCSSSGSCIEVGGPADVAVELSASPNPSRVGRDLTYRVVVRNAGPGVATGVVLTEQLDASVILRSWKASQGSCSGSGPVTCALGSVKRGATATVTLVVRPLQGGRIPSGGVVNANEVDPRPGNDGRSIRTLVCTRLGTPGPDALKGTNGPDVICGLGGGDTIDGYGGADLIVAGSGNDVVHAGGGNDVVFGGGGDDILYGGWGNDTLFGGSGHDSLFGGPGVDTCRLGPDGARRISCEV